MERNVSSGTSELTLNLHLNLGSITCCLCKYEKAPNFFTTSGSSLQKVVNNIVFPNDEVPSTESNT